MQNFLWKIICCFFPLVIVSMGCTRQDMSQQDLNLQMMESASASVAAPPPEQKKTVLRLPAEDTGNRNPYSHANAKLSITPLLYQSLYTLDDDYIPTEALASSMREEGRAYTITLQPNARFSDGSQITAQDIVASLQEALKYPSAYSSLFRSVESCSATENGQVLILLRQEDRNAAALFTFPICKAGTQSEPLPIGSGAFVLDGSSPTRMHRNPFYNSYNSISQIPKDMETVELIPVTDDESLEYMLKIGVIDFYFSADARADLYGYGSTEQLTLNRMTFLGFNRSSYSLLHNPDLVQAVKKIIDKEQMVSYAYGTLAEIVDYPFHPGYWGRINGEQLLEQNSPSTVSQSSESGPGAALDGTFQAELPTLEETMARLGYTSRDQDGFWIRDNWGSPQRMSLRILVNAENEPRQQMAQILVERLAEIGIEGQVISQAYETYLQSVSSKQFDFYFGEVRMESNMDVSRLFSSENAPKMGFEYNAALEEAAIFLKTGQTGYKGFLTAFSDASAMEPICYQKGSFSYSRSLPGDFITLHRELFLDIQNW
jgi:ABC-type transport system substrate-binding protein